MRKLLMLAFLPSLFLVATPSSAAEAGAIRTVTLAVQNMTCGGCALTVKRALKQVDGVIEAKADYGTHSATVTFDPGKATLEALTRATTRAGFPSTVKEQ